MQCGRETNCHVKIPAELLVELTEYFPRVLSSDLMGISVVSLNLVLAGMNRPRSYEKSSGLHWYSNEDGKVTTVNNIFQSCRFYKAEIRFTNIV